MAIDVNHNHKYLSDPKKPKPAQADTRSTDGTYQTCSDWLRRGGQKPSAIFR
jgi:hypothetical protein